MISPRSGAGPVPLYDAEQRIVKALPRMVSAASDEEPRTAYGTAASWADELRAVWSPAA